MWRTLRQLSTKPGFTLIELLIVIAIILILIAIALPNFLSAQLRAKVADVRGCQRTIRTANEAYHADFRYYAPDVDGNELVPGSFWAWKDMWRRLPYLNSCDSEICTYMMLTTPIAYMKEFCFEPFIGRTDRSAIPGNKKLAFFEYSTPRHQGNGPGSFSYETAKRYGLGYVMISMGPDLGPNYDWENGWLTLGRRTYIPSSPIYSPTNGVRSVGDIVTTNRGPEG